MPRRYTLGRRANQKTDTRQRIIAAAADIYRDRGVAAATYPAIARAADVAPGTVRNHFPEPRFLAGAVLDQVLQGIAPPGPEILEGIDGLGARLRKVGAELAASYDRSEAWWRAFERDLELQAVFAEGAGRFDRLTNELIRAALGPLGDDPENRAVVAAVIGPPAFFALRQRGISADRAVELGVYLLVPWLEARADDAAGQSGRRSRDA